MKLFRESFMPVPGVYSKVDITKEDFINKLKNVDVSEVIQSYVGQKARALILGWTGIKLQLCLKDVNIQNDEEILVMEMNFRAKVKDNTLYLPEFIFSSVHFKEF